MIGHAGWGTWQRVSCQHQSPFALPCRQWGQPAEEWQGSHARHECSERGIAEELQQRRIGAPPQGRWRYGSEGAPSPHPESGPDWVWSTLTSQRAAYRPVLMVAAPQSHASPHHTPPTTLAPHWPRAAHINATLISKGADQPIMHSSVKIQGLKGILMPHHTLQNDLNVQYKRAICGGHTLHPKPTIHTPTRCMFSSLIQTHSYLTLHDWEHSALASGHEAGCL